MRQHGAVVPVWQIHRAIGMGGDLLVPTVAGQDFEDEHGDAVRASEATLYFDLIEEVEPLPDARDFVLWLKERGHRVILSSSAKAGEVDHYLDLLDVPVKVYSAVSSKSVRFHQLHAEDGGRIKQKRTCSLDGEEVPYEEIVKGYEIGPDRYVIITPEELEAVDPKASRTIDIEDYVELDEVDPIYFDHAYYLAPATGAGKSYRLLHQAMLDSGKAAIARMV